MVDDTIQVKALCEPVRRAIASISRKKSVCLSVSDRAVKTFGTWWDGGSRSEYWLLDLRGVIQRVHVPAMSPAEAAPQVVIEPRAGFAVVEGGVFCGKQAQPHIVLWSFGNEQLAALQIALLHGECSWGIVADKMKDLSLVA